MRETTHPLAWLVAAACLTAGVAHADVERVIPPGQERIISDMLRTGDDLPGECRLKQAAIRRGHILVRYLCGADDAEARVVLYPPGRADDPTARTERFDVVGVEGHDPPDGLVDALAERIRDTEERFHWLKVRGEVHAGGPVEPTAPLPPPGSEELPTRELDPEHIALFEEGMELYRAKEHREALERFMTLAHEDPHFAGALGMVVANLAPTHPDAEDVARYAEQADADPDDPVKQFVAGVAAHYSAHYKAATSERKAELYRQTIDYLERARQELDLEPRIFIYLAVSHYRLGHQEEAEKLIERGVQLATHDPDAYYCRAEILHRKDVDRALADLGTYLEMIDRFREAGGWVSQGKIRRVEAMRDHLRKVAAGDAKLSELFDPLAGDTPGFAEEPPSGVDQTVRSPEGFATLIAIVAGAAGMILFAGLLLSRRRRRSGDPAAS
ncbi:MAG: tetratricopeptide repeat protein [Myxococcota bacterium]